MSTIDILYDISVLGLAQVDSRARTGVYRVVENIATELSQRRECRLRFCTAIDNEQDCLAYLKSQPRFDGYDCTFIDKNTKIETGDGFFYGKLNHLLDLFGLYRGILVYHSPYFSIPDNILQNKTIAKVQTIYDLIPILFPQYFEKDHYQAMKTLFENIAPDVFVLCISQSTKQDLCNFNKHIDPHKVFVTSLAASELFYSCSDQSKIASVRKKYAIPEGTRYLLSVCTLEPRKNVEQTIRCFVRMVLEQRLSDLCLVLTGTKGWKYEKIFAEIEHAAEVKDRIILTGFVPDEDLAPLYSGALAFVYPSLYEGFGLPPLEAMQCGTPVITSNTSSLPEVVGSAGIMVDPTDGDALCEAMLSIYRDTALAQGLSRKSLARARQFSWEKCISETIAVYRKALEDRPRGRWFQCASV